MRGWHITCFVRAAGSVEPSAGSGRAAQHGGQRGLCRTGGSVTKSVLDDVLGFAIAAPGVQGSHRTEWSVGSWPLIADKVIVAADRQICGGNVAGSSHAGASSPINCTMQPGCSAADFRCTTELPSRSGNAQPSHVMFLCHATDDVAATGVARHRGYCSQVGHCCALRASGRMQSPSWRTRLFKSRPFDAWARTSAGAGFPDCACARQRCSHNATHVFTVVWPRSCSALADHCCWPPGCRRRASAIARRVTTMAVHNSCSVRRSPPLARRMAISSGVSSTPGWSVAGMNCSG